MLESSLPAIWASMNSWFTPTVLFVLLNIVIGTIAFSSSPDRKRPAQDAHHPAAAAQNNLSRTSSVLHRLKSINLYRQKTDEIQPATTFLDPDPSPAPPVVEEHHFGRSASDGAAAELQPKEEEPKKMKKWASSKSAFMEPSRKEEEEITGVRRPATMRAGRVVDESVDAKADDFINKFRNQLKLQRLDSINRFKDMINRA